VAETVVGATTGALAAPKGYFKAMKSVCRKYGALFILDEVMSGMGRESPGSPRGLWHLTGDVGMGTTHAWESFGDNVPPDIQAVAKGLGGGYAVLDCISQHLF
jgi:E3 ubiquitin-protein ligase TRIP12